MEDLFNSREIAIGIWTAIFFFFIFTKKDFRKSFSKLISSALHRQILIPIILMIVYNSAVIKLLSILGMWRFDQLKDTITWFLFTGFAAAFSLVTDRNEVNPFKKVVKNNIKIMVLVEFIVHTYTFPLYVEIILFPTLILLGGFSALSKIDNKYAEVEKVTSWCLMGLGTVIIVFVSISFISNYERILNMNKLHDMLLPPLLTLLFVPFIYMLMLLMAYEIMFVRLNMFLKASASLRKYAKIKLIKKCKFNLRMVRNALGENAFQLFEVSSKEDVDRILFQYNNTSSNAIA